MGREFPVCLEATDSPLDSTNVRQFGVVQGDCERVYYGTTNSDMVASARAYFTETPLISIKIR